MIFHFWVNYPSQNQTIYLLMLSILFAIKLIFTGPVFCEVTVFHFFFNTLQFRFNGFHTLSAFTVFILVILI